MIEKELKLAKKELLITEKNMDKIKSQLDHHQKEHQRFELKFKKMDTTYQEKRGKLQVTTEKNIKSAREKEQSLVPLITRELELKAQIEILEKLNV